MEGSGTRKAGERVARIPEAIFDAVVSVYAFRVFCVLALHANDGGVCWPSVSTVSHQAQIARGTTLDALCELREAGLVSILSIGRGRAPNRYQISVHPVDRNWNREANSGSRHEPQTDNDRCHSGSSGEPQSGLSVHGMAVAVHGVDPNIELEDKEGGAPPPHAPGASRRAGTPPDPAHGTTVALFFELYRARVGNDPPFSGKESALLAGDLKRLGVDRLQKFLRRALAGDGTAPARVEEFLRERGYSYALLRSQFSAFEVTDQPTRSPTPQRQCRACGRAVVFGTGRSTRCFCGTHLELDDHGEILDVSAEMLTHNAPPSGRNGRAVPA